MSSANRKKVDGDLRAPVAGSANQHAPGGRVPPQPAGSPDDESPGVPGFRTWRGVYLFVFGAFIFFVAALAIVSRAYA
jgi:hypothetical protein